MPDSTRLQPDCALPLPRRLWWPWDQPAARVGFDRRFEACEAGQAALFLSSSGPLQVWLDGQHLKIPDSPLPLWRAMRRIPVALSAGGHRLCLEAAPGSHRQPFVMACLDWHEAGAGRRLATDAAWRMACDPAAGWASRPPDEGWRPAWAFDGVWAEPWGMPCDAPDDFCRLSTGWQTMQEAPLVRGIGYPGLAAAGGRAEVGAGGALIFQPVPPYPQAPPALPEARPRLEWYRTREAHSLVNNVWLDLFERRAPHVVLVNPADMGNLGTVARTMAGFGFGELAVVTPAADVFHPKTVRASMGALFRLNVARFVLPPLRDRREDIPLLVDHFLETYARKNGKPPLRVTREAMDELVSYSFPGNVRELENIIERAVVLARSDVLDVADLPSHVTEAEHVVDRLVFPIGTPLHEIERQAIQKTLAHTGGDKQLAAQLLGISARTIYRKLDASSAHDD